MGRAKGRGSTVHGGEGDESRAARRQQFPSKEWRPLPDDIARDSEEEEDGSTDNDDDGEGERGRDGRVTGAVAAAAASGE